MRQWWATADRRLRIAVVATPLVLACLCLGIGGPIAWYLGSPLFIDQTVDESFPTVVAAPAATAVPAASGGVAGTGSRAATTTAAPAAGGGAAPTATGATTGGAATAPSAPAAAGGAPPAGGSAGAAPAPTSAAAAPPAAPSGPVALTSGTFGVVDEVHKGEGKATIFQLPDGKRVLRLEDFRVTNGPDLYVYLSAHPAPRTTKEVHEAGEFEVARLKANIGNQNYDLPADLDLGKFKSVVIYCKRFTTVFSTAEMKNASSGVGNDRAASGGARSIAPADGSLPARGNVAAVPSRPSGRPGRGDGHAS